MITVATVLLGTGARGDRPGRRNRRTWRVIERWIYTGLIGLGTAMGGAWLGDPFGHTARYCGPWAHRHTEHDDHEGG